jgi:tetratricopeptide (TPR) repeat protein
MICALPILYYGAAVANVVHPSEYVAQGITVAADYVADSNYPNMSLPIYDAAIAIQPKNTDILVKKMYILGKSGNVEEARQYLEDIVVMSPNETTPVIRIGDLLFEQGKYEESLKYYEKALSADPDNAKILVKKGDAYLMISIIDMQKIRSYYRNLTNPDKKYLDSSDASTMDAFRSTESYRTAMKAYNKAIEIDPMMSIAITGRILTATQNLLNTYEGILDDIGCRNTTCR